MGIFFQAGIQNRVRNLIGDLVRVTLGHGFGGKQVAMVGQSQNSFILRHGGRLKALQLDIVILRSIRTLPKRISANWETPNILRLKGWFPPAKGAKSALKSLPN
jgi:hypothetical protein